MVRSIRFAWLVTAGLLLLAIPASAQIRFGETSTSATGTISSGYTGNLREYDSDQPMGGPWEGLQISLGLFTVRIFSPITSRRI